MGDLESLKSLVQVISYLIGALAAILAFCVYRRNSRLERARWMASLYSKFYEQKELKPVRERLDCEPTDDSAISGLISEESAEFTDYLNFFEFVAYLRETGELREKDVKAIFGYYLDCLKKHEKVREYILDERKGYEYLRRLMVS